MKRYRPILALLVFSISLIGGFFTHGAGAISTSSFDPTHIIDDSVFYNTSSMTVSQIQAFLNSKVSVCDTQGTQPFSGGTRAQYGIAHGYPPPYVCLKDYYENPATQADNFSGSIPSGAISAAQIISTAATYYGINPQVLIVLLQKEQGLVTDTWPAPYEYQKATGYGCPDTAPCNTAYYGFYNQVNLAAQQFRRYATNPNNYNYVVGPGNYVQYSPIASCGGTSLNIQNQATASLYDYTPYQPSPAALAAGYGTTPSCGAYGNRNFWLYFNDWFGSTIGPFYQFKDAINPPAQLGYGQVATAQVRLTNTSTQTWYSDGNVPTGGHPFRLMMRGYTNNDFADTTDPAWLGTQNQIKMVEPSVAPGGTATFTFRVRAPSYTTSNYPMNMTLVQDGVQVYQDLGLQFLLNSLPDYAYSVVSADTPPGLLPGDMYQAVFKLKNTGTNSWYSDSNLSTGNPHPIRLATPYYKSIPYAFPRVDPAWLGTQNQIRMVEPVVAPGQVGTFTAILTAPYTQIDNYSPNLELVLDGVKFIAGPSIPTTISTPEISPDYSFVSATNPPTTMTAGQQTTVYIKIKNTGNVIWRNFDYKILSYNGSQVLIGDTRMLTSNPVYSNSPFAPPADSTWLGTQNQIRMVEPVVAPGQVGTFSVNLKAPATPGKYTQYFTFGIDGRAILKDIGLAYTVTVVP